MKTLLAFIALTASFFLTRVVLYIVLGILFPSASTLVSFVLETLISLLATLLSCFLFIKIKSYEKSDLQIAALLLFIMAVVIHLIMIIALNASDRVKIEYLSMDNLLMVAHLFLGIYAGWLIINTSETRNT